MSNSNGRKPWTAPGKDEHTGNGGLFHKKKGQRELVTRTKTPEEAEAEVLRAPGLEVSPAGVTIDQVEVVKTAEPGRKR